MGIFGEQTYGSLRPEPIGLPVEDLKAANQQLEGQYLTNRENANQLQIAIANMQVLNKDEHFKSEVLDKVQANLNNVVERNDWEYAQPVVSDAAKTAATDKGFNAAQKMKVYRDTWIDEKKKKEGINSNDLATGIAINDDVYGGIQLDENGNPTGQWGAVEVVADPDLNKMFNDLGKDFASDKSPVRFDSNGKAMEGWKENGKFFMRPVGSMYLQTMEVEEVNEQDVANFYMAAVGNDPKVQAYLNMKNQFSNYESYGTPNLREVNWAAESKISGVSNAQLCRQNAIQAMMARDPSIRYDQATGMVLGPKMETVTDPSTGQTYQKHVTQKQGNEEVPVFEVLPVTGDGSPKGQINDLANFDFESFANYTNQLNNNAYLGQFAGAYAEKYGFEKTTANYYIDKAAELALEHSYRIAEKKYENDLLNQSTTFQSSEHGNTINYKTPKDLQTEIEKAKNDPAAKTPAGQQKIAELEDQLRQSYMMNMNAYVTQLRTNSPQLVSRTMNRIKSIAPGDPIPDDIRAFYKASYGNATNDADIRQFIVKAKEGRINEQFVERGIASVMAQGGYSTDSNFSGILTEDERNAWDDDPYFGTTRYGFNTGVGDTQRDRDFVQIGGSSKRNDINQFYVDNPVTENISIDHVVFGDKKAQDRFDYAQRNALELQGVITTDDGKNISINDYLLENKITLNAAEGKWEQRDDNGKVIGSGTYNVYGGTRSGQNIQQLDLGNGKKFNVSTPGSYTGTDYTHGQIFYSGGLTEDANSTKGWSATKKILASGACDNVSDGSHLDYLDGQGSVITTDLNTKFKNPTTQVYYDQLQQLDASGNRTQTVSMIGGTTPVKITGQISALTGSMVYTVSTSTGNYVFSKGNAAENAVSFGWAINQGL